MSSSVVIVVAFLLVFLAEIVADRPGFHVPRGGTGRLPQINVPKLPSASQQVPRVEIPKVDTRPHNIPKIDGPRDNTHSELSRIDTPKVSSENHHRTEISSGSQRTFESGGKHSSLDQNFGRRGGSNEESHRHNFNGNRGNGETHPNANGRENTETSRRTEDSNREDRTRGMDSSHRFDGNTHERSRNSEGHSESGGQRESARNDHKNSHQNRRVLKQHELPGDKDDKESVKHEYMQFRSAHGNDPILFYFTVYQLIMKKINFIHLHFYEI